MILAIVLAAFATLFAAAPAQAEPSDGYKFLESVRKKEGEKVEEALMNNAQLINSRDVSTGETPLLIVTRRRDITWLSFLIGKGANVNLADDRGHTPLETAVSFGWRDGVELLLSRKARTDISNDAGETPLIFAVHRRDMDMVKALLDAGADPDRADNSGRSAREYAKVENSPQISQVIEQAAAKGKKKAAVYGPVM